jgi:hypothetical protein
MQRALSTYVSNSCNTHTSHLTYTIIGAPRNRGLKGIRTDTFRSWTQNCTGQKNGGREMNKRKRKITRTRNKRWKWIENLQQKKISFLSPPYLLLTRKSSVQKKRLRLPDWPQSERAMRDQNISNFLPLNSKNNWKLPHDALCPQFMFWNDQASVRKILPLCPILCQLNPLGILTHYFYMTKGKHTPVRD